MFEVNPENIPNVRYDERGRNILYVEILRAIYGCIESVIQWYRLFTTTQQTEGFVLNPYDMCIANKNINGRQCRIAWYVDDCMCTYHLEEVLDNIANMLQKHFNENEDD